jgi:hypothetical protein
MYVHKNTHNLKNGANGWKSSPYLSCYFMLQWQILCLQARLNMQTVNQGILAI